MTTQTRVTLAMLSMTLLSVLLYGAYSLSQTHDLLRESEVARLTAVADARVSEIRTLVRGFEVQSKLVASRTRLRELLAAEIAAPARENRAGMQRILADAARSTPVVRSISLVAPDGIVVASTDQALIGLAASEAPPAFGRPPGDGGSYGIQHVLDGPTIHLVSFTGVERDGRSIGTMQITFAPEALHAFRRAIAQSGFGETGEVLLGLRAPDGRIATIEAASAELRGAARTPASRDGAEPLARALAGRDGALTEGAVDLDGTHVVAVHRHLPELGWGLVAKLDEAELQARFHSARLALIAFGIALVLMSLLVGRFFGGRLAQAHTRLQSELEKRTRVEQRFARVFDSAPSPMMMVTTDGRITRANDHLERLLGYGSGELVGAEVESLVPAMQQSKHRARRERYCRAPAELSLGADRGARAMHREGHEVPVEIGLIPVESGDETHVLAGLVDLSDRMRAERALREHAQALEHSNRELDAFAYVASHDLRSPLRGIDQLAEFIEQDAGDVMPQDSLQDLRMLRGRAARMDRLLTDLLAYARIGRRESESVAVDTGEMAREIAELYVPGERFAVEMPEDMPVIHAPRAAVELVMRNLLMNSVAHHDRQEGRIRFDWREDDEFVHLRLADDGPGIPLDKRERAFELFQTLGGGSDSESSGMGLAFVQKTMATHGGRVTIVDALERGTIFETCWPRAAEQAKPDDPPLAREASPEAQRS